MLKTIKEYCLILKDKVMYFALSLIGLFYLTPIKATDAFTVAGTASDNLKTKLTTLASKIFPVALLVCVISMLITKDEKKLGMEKNILKGLIIVYIIFLMINADIITNTISQITGLGL